MHINNNEGLHQNFSCRQSCQIKNPQWAESCVWPVKIQWTPRIMPPWSLSSPARKKSILLKRVRCTWLTYDNQVRFRTLVFEHPRNNLQCWYQHLVDWLKDAANVVVLPDWVYQRSEQKIKEVTISLQRKKMKRWLSRMSCKISKLSNQSRKTFPNRRLTEVWPTILHFHDTELSVRSWTSFYN